MSIDQLVIGVQTCNELFASRQHEEVTKIVAATPSSNVRSIATDAQVVDARDAHAILEIWKQVVGLVKIGWMVKGEFQAVDTQALRRAARMCRLLGPNAAIAGSRPTLASEMEVFAVSLEAVVHEHEEAHRNSAFNKLPPATLPPRGPAAPQ